MCVIGFHHDACNSTLQKTELVWFGCRASLSKDNFWTHIYKWLATLNRRMPERPHLIDNFNKPATDDHKVCFVESYRDEQNKIGLSPPSPNKSIGLYETVQCCQWELAEDLSLSVCGDITTASTFMLSSPHWRRVSLVFGVGMIFFTQSLLAKI